MSNTTNQTITQHGFTSFIKAEIVPASGFASTKRGEFAKSGFELHITGECDKFGLATMSIASGFRTETAARAWAKRKGIAA